MFKKQTNKKTRKKYMWSQPDFYLLLYSSHLNSGFPFINAFSHSISVFNKELTLNMILSQAWFPLSSVPL